MNQIRNIPKVTGCSAAGFQDASLWEEAKKKGDASIKKLIDEGLKNTSVTVVCVGEKTSGRKFINYEIEQSIARGNGLVAIQIHHLKNSDGQIDSPGLIPAKIKNGGYKAYKYADSDSLAEWIEDAAKAAEK